MVILFSVAESTVKDSSLPLVSKLLPDVESRRGINSLVDCERPLDRVNLANIELAKPSPSSEERLGYRGRVSRDMTLLPVQKRESLGWVGEFKFQNSEAD